jgi:endonuclease YncB( thermonuclease family)
MRLFAFLKRFNYILLAATLYLQIDWQVACANQVKTVIDGDTFILTNGQHIRLWGIDAPETGQPLAKEAKLYLTVLVKDREVELNCIGRSYNRRVCKATINNIDLGRELVGWGLAFDYPKYSKGFYARAENFAQKEQRGVWQLSNGGIRPWDYRVRKD